MNEGVSVIICCYNSDWIIARTLSALKKQIMPPGLKWEILLVDNNCVDNTVQIAQETMSDSIIPFRVVKEIVPGLLNARKKGVAEAKYSILVYCDDDNLLSSDYIRTMYEIMRDNPVIGAVGGLGIPEYETSPDKIVMDNPWDYALGSQKGHKDWLFGAGVTLRTEIVRDIYSNQKMYLTGRCGNRLLSGDDSELILSVVLRGYKIYPTDAVSFTHVLKSSRLTKEYYLKMKEGLVLPIPAFTTMRAAIGGIPFIRVVRIYLGLYISWLVNFFLTNKEKRNYAQETIRLWKFWGIGKLYSIYNEWSRIKRNRECHVSSHITR